MSRRYRAYAQTAGSPPPDPVLWTPNDDPDLLLWYDASSYDIVEAISELDESAYEYVEMLNKRTGYTGATYRQDPIGIPSAPTNAPILATVDGIPCVRYRARGTKCSATFSLNALDVYLVCKAGNFGGAYSRFVDHNYGTGFWLGSAGSGNIGGGVKQGTPNYGEYLAANAGWNLLNISRHTDSADYGVCIGADDGKAIGGTGTSGATNSNPIGIGSELGGNSAVPDFYVAAVLVFSSCPGTQFGDIDDINAKRQGYIHHTYGVPYSIDLITNPAHLYYNDPPTV